MKMKTNTPTQNANRESWMPERWEPRGVFWLQVTETGKEVRHSARPEILALRVTILEVVPPVGRRRNEARSR